ncbi:MAG: hypothetical protein HYV34_00035 [Candidatus Kerfeldbacteria bacterium]|nr:hypothetical protein [Candidatus Kerfeldbacteria bacterium]
MKYRLIFVIMIGVLLPVVNPARAQEKTIVALTGENLESGVTATTDDGTFSVRFSPKVIQKAGSISLRRLTEVQFPDKPGATRVGDYYHYSVNVEGVGMLKRPLFITTTFEGNPYNLVRLHYYNKTLQEWKPLPSRVNLEEHTVVSTSPFPTVTLAAFEESALRIDFSKQDFTKDVSLESPDGNFALGFPAGALDTSARVVLKRFDLLDDDTTIPKNAKMVSPAIYEFGLRSDEPLTLNGLLPVRLSVESTSASSKSMYVLDKRSDTWRKITSKYDANTGVVTAHVPFLYAPLAVFEEQTSFEGTASWYRGNAQDDAATNLFPLGTKVKVTNLDTGASTIVNIVSTWAGTSRHIIDLTFSAFSTIASPWKGVARVRVEHIE